MQQVANPVLLPDCWSHHVLRLASYVCSSDHGITYFQSLVLLPMLVVVTEAFRQLPKLEALTSPPSEI